MKITYTVKPRFTVPRFTGSLNLPGLNSLPRKQALCVNQCKLHPDLPCPSNYRAWFLSPKRPGKSGFYCIANNRYFCWIFKFHCNSLLIEMLILTLKAFTIDNPRFRRVTTNRHPKSIVALDFRYLHCWKISPAPNRVIME